MKHCNKMLRSSLLAHEEDACSDVAVCHEKYPFLGASPDGLECDAYKLQDMPKASMLV